MKLLVRSAVLALGPAVLCCFALVRPLIGRTHLEMYHNSGPVDSIFLATILNVAVFWILLTFTVTLAAKPGRIQVTLWSGLILMLLCVFLIEGRTAGEWDFSQRTGVAIVLASFLCWVAVICFWRPSFLPGFTRIRHAAEILLGFTAISATIFLGQLFWAFWQARALNFPRPLRSQTLPAASAPKPRVIWIVLDELSYQQVYERRYPGLDLPAFDALARQSTVFTHAMPAGILTDKVLPSLLTGVKADDIRASPDGVHLSLLNADTHRWQNFDPRQTVFEDADRMGYRTAVAGWFNPYCRILPEVLDQCFWTSRTSYIGSMETMKADEPVLTNAIAPWRAAVASVSNLLERRAPSPAVDWNHIADYRDLLSAGDRFLSDPSLNFVLLHLPIPHPGGIYSRRTHTFGSPGASYIDNLALADQYLDHLCLLLKQRGEWDSATIVIMGDHSWRTKLMWISDPVWTPEDQAASLGGQFDDHPAYIVKLPHQSQPARIDAPFAAIRTRALFDELLAGRIHSPEELATFATARPADRQPPPDLAH